MNDNKIYSYKYTGEIEVTLADYGVVQPKETIQTNFEVIHPLFESQDQTSKPKRAVQTEPEKSKEESV